MHPRLFDLNEAQALVRNTARDYAQKTLAPIAAQLDREARFPREQLAELAELGLMGVNVPEQYGGAAAGAVAYALAMMEIAQGCASTAVTMAVTNLVAETIVRFGTEEQKKRYVPEITSGRFVAASFGLSESNAGSDAAFCGVVLAQHGDETRLVLADQLRVDGRGESRFVGEMVVERADAHLGLAPNLVQRGHECAVGREPAPRHLQQPVPRV